MWTKVTVLSIFGFKFILHVYKRGSKSLFYEKMKLPGGCWCVCVGLGDEREANRAIIIFVL
jgi:hypothetical protein